jgi:CRISPR-associated protein Csb3
MNKPVPSLTLPLDPKNPGQFYACCGLLELAARLDVNAVGWFDCDRFEMNGCVDGLLDRLFGCDVQVNITDDANGRTDDEGGADDEPQINPHRGRIPSMRLLEPFHLLLDWWRDDRAQKQKLKTWTAGQRVTDVFVGDHKKRRSKGGASLVYIPSMREHFRRAAQEYPLDWLRAGLPIEAPSSFGFDSRLSRNSALDLGHTEGGTFRFSPAIDVLTLIGFQRFRPNMVEPWSHNRYYAWREPLPVHIASVAALGILPGLSYRGFEFPIIRRDSQGRFKLFGAATTC